jgi:hypothetical protein
VNTTANGIDHATLYAMREKNPQLTEALAPAEHRAFAREWVRENPYLAFPSLLFAIPAYQGAKALGLRPQATKPSLAQMAEAYKGMWEGLPELFK